MIGNLTPDNIDEMFDKISELNIDKESLDESEDVDNLYFVMKKYAEFTTDHFSMYGIEAEVSQQTYDGIKLSFIIFTLGISLSIITLKYNRKILETK